MFLAAAVRDKWVFLFVQESSLHLLLSSPPSVQQRPGEHEDPAAEPDGAHGELGAPADHLPPARHQLHGVLQLGEARRGRREDLHQDRRPEDGERTAVRGGTGVEFDTL